MSRVRTTLPAKPSALIRIAMDDLNKVERLKGYEVDMGRWHDIGYEDGKCRVCFAGAVMAQTLGVKPDEAREPHSFGHDTSSKLKALDDFRVGYVYAGLSRMGVGRNYGYDFDVAVPHYAEDRRGFKLAMRKLIRDLAAAKL